MAHVATSHNFHGLPADIVHQISQMRSITMRLPTPTAKLFKDIVRHDESSIHGGITYHSPFFKIRPHRIGAVRFGRFRWRPSGTAGIGRPCLIRTMTRKYRFETYHAPRQNVMWLALQYLGNIMADGWEAGMDDEEVERLRVAASQYPIWEMLYNSWCDRRWGLEDDIPWYDNLN